jgi:hypothetical protein
VYVFKEDAWGKIDTGGNATYYDMLRLVSQGRARTCPHPSG